MGGTLTRVSVFGVVDERDTKSILGEVSPFVAANFEFC